MKNFAKLIAKEVSNESFTLWSHYQPKMPDSLMDKIQAENKKEG